MYTYLSPLSGALQTVFEQAFTNGLANQAALATGTLEKLGTGTCSNGTFLAAQYALAIGSMLQTNQTAAGLALAAANNLELAGCSLAAASGIPLAEAGCSAFTQDVLSSQSFMLSWQLHASRSRL